VLKLPGNIPPAEAEERYYAMIEKRPMAGWRKTNMLERKQDGCY
jgi:hypothetical protein